MYWVLPLERMHMEFDYNQHVALNYTGSLTNKVSRQKLALTSLVVFRPDPGAEYGDTRHKQ